MRTVKWVGDPSPWSDRRLVDQLVLQTMPMPLVERFRRFENHQRSCAIPGQSEYVLGPEHGFSRRYKFGPTCFIERMEDADAALLFSNEWDRWQFLDVTDLPESTPRPLLTKEQWRSVLESFEKLTLRRTLRR